MRLKEVETKITLSSNLDSMDEPDYCSRSSGRSGVQLVLLGSRPGTYLTKDAFPHTSRTRGREVGREVAEKQHTIMAPLLSVPAPEQVK